MMTMGDLREKKEFDETGMIRKDNCLVANYSSAMVGLLEGKRDDEDG